MRRLTLAREHQAFQRRRPRQSRSRATCDSILEAAVLVLQQGGELTTNRVAERAGVSIGTLYQYFPDKEAILLAAALREAEAEATPRPLTRQQALLRGLARALEGLLARALPAPARGGALGLLFA